MECRRQISMASVCQVLRMWHHWPLSVIIEIIFLNQHNDSSTIPVACIVQCWSTSVEMTFSGTMKEENLKDCRSLIRIIGRHLHTLNCACAFMSLAG